MTPSSACAFQFRDALAQFPVFLQDRQQDGQQQAGRGRRRVPRRSERPGPHSVPNLPYVARGPETALIEARGLSREETTIYSSVSIKLLAHLQLGQISYAVVN